MHETALQLPLSGSFMVALSLVKASVTGKKYRP